MAADCVCSKNVMLYYELNTRLFSTNPRYVERISTEDECRMQCLDDRLCKYMWWSPATVCYLYNEKSTGKLQPSNGHAVLEKQCGDCEDVFERQSSRQVEMETLPPPFPNVGELHCLQIFTAHTTSQSTSQHSTSEQSTIERFTTGHLMTEDPSSEPHTSEPITTGHLTIASEDEANITLIDKVITIDRILTTNSSQLSVSTDGTIESNSGTNTRQQATKIIKDSSSIMITTTRGIWTGTNDEMGTDDSTSLSITTDRKTGSSSTYERLVTSTNPQNLIQTITTDIGLVKKNSKRTISESRGLKTLLNTPYTIAKWAQAVHEQFVYYDVFYTISVMCEIPQIYPNMVIHGNGRYYVNSVATVSCTGHGYRFLDGGTHRTLICLPQGRWHSVLENSCSSRKNLCI
ncbi:hypothetical protein LSH36_45g12026 [Paralvinella palmiformis]|uniref:Apple domain-containing protein n=1 Tax=Paralvinella palmiformis TaxID=53620 RepID=A0AAD9K870_9ANNE|nr:hypothetical protein LSH36_45g12026 [Paralvinella palmiformis]